MRSRIYAFLMSPFLLASGHRLLAQADTTKYNERALLVNQEVWGWKVPAFANYKIPADYSGESSVILARRATIEADSKKRMNWLGGLDRKFYYNSTVREMVKIGDKAALDEYSQLSFRQFKKLNGWITGTSTTFVGARIIKPNGSIKQINLDETVILQAGKDMQRKLAISDLQVGDILDYFVRVEEYSVNFRQPERLIFLFGDDHPIMDYSIHCEIGNKYGVEYRSINKAPEAKQGTNEDKDVLLDLDVKNIPAVPTGLWMSSLRQIPAFRINVLAGIGSGHTGEVSKGVPLVDVLRGADPLADAQVVYMVRTWTDKILRDYDRGFVKAPDDSLARLIYYAQRFALFYNRTDDNSALEVGEDRNHMALNSDIFLVALRDMLKFHHITSDFVALPSRYGPPIDDVMGPGDVVVLLRVNTTKPFYINCNNMFTCPGPIPAYLEGQPCIELSGKNLRKNASVDMTMKMPYSRPEDNLHQENLQIDMNDKQLLHIRRQTTLTGAMKEDEQLHLLNFEDCYEAERQALRVDKSIMDDLKKARKSKNISEDYATAVQKARASLKDRFKDEISSEFTEDPKEMIKWSVDKPGLRDYDPNLVYSTEFTMDGLVQRAGNNYIVSIGKTVNSPLKLSPSQRTRKVDVVMPYARVLDCSVSFAVPQGFTVQGIDKLNRKVENECGSLVTTAQVQGNQLVVHFKRVYRHDAESVAKWPDLLAIIDATAEFADQKVLLKKG